MLLSSGKQTENFIASQSFLPPADRNLKMQAGAQILHPPESVMLLSFGEFWHREIYFLTHSRLYFANAGNYTLKKERINPFVVEYMHA